MASARAALRFVGNATWHLGWGVLLLGGFGLCVGSAPSPGSEWNAGAAAALLLIPAGMLGLGLGALLRWGARRLETPRAAEPRGTARGTHGPKRD